MPDLDPSEAKAQCKQPNCLSTHVHLHCHHRADVDCSWVICNECGCTSDALSADPQAFFRPKAKRG